MTTQSAGTATRAGIEGGNVTVFVNDFNRAVAFYTETLGLGLLYRAGDHWAMIDAGQGMQIGLHPPGERVPAPGTKGSMQVGLNVTEPIEQVVETLQQRGVEFAEHEGRVVIDDGGSVKLAFFHDPDGNVLYLCEVAHG